MIDASIVIPSHNRSEAVRGLVAALMAQHDPAHPTEIIVVLDGSSDGSAEALSQLPVAPGMRLCVHSQTRRGRAGARNAGFARSSGDVVIFLDDDVVPCEGIVTAHLRAHRTADVVLGRIEHLPVAGLPKAISDQDEFFYRQRHLVLAAEGATIRATDVFAGHLSVKSALLRGVGGFDQAFTGYGCEDWDLGQRLMEAGAVFAYAPDATVFHRSAVTPRQWRRHAWQEGQSQLTLIRKHPTLASSLDIGGLHESTWPGRFVAQFAIQFPRLGLIASAAMLRVTSTAGSVLRPELLRRFATQSWRLAFWSGVRDAVGSSSATRQACRFNARILCYHRVCDTPNPALAEWAVTPSAFRGQVRLLRRLGYRAVTLHDLIRDFESGRPLDKLVVITFDDGYVDTVTTAAPILDEVGFPATVFVVPGLVGEAARWDEEFGGEMAPLASWDDLRLLRDRGWEIGLHTTSHEDLTTLSEEETTREIGAGLAELEHAIGKPVTSFAYPYGEFTSRLAEIVAASGIRAAVALGHRHATPGAPRFALERAPVLRSHSLRDFRFILLTGSTPRELVGLALKMPLRAIRPRRRPAG